METLRFVKTVVTYNERIITSVKGEEEPKDRNAPP